MEIEIIEAAGLLQDRSGTHPILRVPFAATQRMTAAGFSAAFAAATRVLLLRNVGPAAAFVRVNRSDDNTAAGAAVAGSIRLRPDDSIAVGLDTPYANEGVRYRLSVTAA